MASSEKFTKVENLVPSVVSPQTFMVVVQKYECLYNKSNRDYKDKYKKFNSWTKIGETFAMTPQEAESKYKNIRTGFGRYFRRAVSFEHIKTTSNLKGDLTELSGFMHWS